MPTVGRRPRGGERGSWSAELIAANAVDEHGQAYRDASCTISICRPESIQVVPITPQVIGLRLGRRF